MSANPATPPLFRREVIEQASARAYGSVLLAQPLSSTLLTAVFAGLGALMIAVLAFASYSRRVTVSGLLIPEGHLLRTVASAPGVVSERRVHEGQTVQAGDVLFVFSSLRGSATNGDTDAALTRLLQLRHSSLEQESTQLQAMRLRQRRVAQQRVLDLRDEAQRIDGQLQMQGQRVALAQAAAQRYEQLQARGFVALAQQQDRQAELLDQQQRLADLERARNTAGRQLRAAQAEDASAQLQVQRDLDALARSVASLDQELTESAARQEWQLRAPQSGTISSLSVDRGQTVNAGQTLASIVPSGASLIAELYVPSLAVGNLRPGMTTQLRYSAFPYQKYGQFAGVITEVSGAALAVDEMPVLSGSTGNSAAESIYRVRVRLAGQSVQAYGKPVALRAGLMLEASITLDRRPLYQWLLDPLHTLSARL
jgi:membrane fusion protein